MTDYVHIWLIVFYSFKITQNCVYVDSPYFRAENAQ